MADLGAAQLPVSVTYGPFLDGYDSDLSDIGYGAVLAPIDYDDGSGDVINIVGQLYPN